MRLCITTKTAVLLCDVADAQNNVIGNITSIIIRTEWTLCSKSVMVLVNLVWWYSVECACLCSTVVFCLCLSTVGLRGGGWRPRRQVRWCGSTICRFWQTRATWWPGPNTPTKLVGSRVRYGESRRAELINVESHQIFTDCWLKL